MEKNNVTLILSIIAILTAAGVPLSEQILSDQQDILKNYYVCEFFQAEEHLDIFYFDRLSSSLQRGYPTAGTTKGYIDCSDGSNRKEWQNLFDYAVQEGLDPNKMLNDYLNPNEDEIQVPEPSRGKCWICGKQCLPCEEI